MYSFNNVFLSVSSIDTFSVSQLNAMENMCLGGKFFSRVTNEGNTIVMRAPTTFCRWLKSRRNFESLALYGKGPIPNKKNKLFAGLYWREEVGRLYARYDGKTIPWKNWVKWCSGKNNKATSTV